MDGRISGGSLKIRTRKEERRRKLMESINFEGHAQRRRRRMINELKMLLMPKTMEMQLRLW